MSCTKLSHQLLDLGFFCALGTTEYPGMMRGGQQVKLGTPLTCDFNNGVNVVYDEDGRPWIDGVDLTADVYNRIGELIGEFHIRQGAYVPHSNDGGYFVRELLPKILAASTVTTGQ